MKSRKQIHNEVAQKVAQWKASTEANIFDGTTTKTQQITRAKKSRPNYKAEFENQLNIFFKNHPQYDTNEWRTYLTDIAQRESSFNRTASNGQYSGWFALNILGNYWNGYRAQDQILNMVKYTENNLNSIKKSLTSQELAQFKSMGITQWGLLGGAHLGGVKGLKSYLKGKDNSDGNTYVSDYIIEMNQQHPFMQRNAKSKRAIRYKSPYEDRQLQDFTTPYISQTTNSIINQDISPYFQSYSTQPQEETQSLQDTYTDAYNQYIQDLDNQIQEANNTWQNITTGNNNAQQQYQSTLEEQLRDIENQKYQEQLNNINYAQVLQNFNTQQVQPNIYNSDLQSSTEYNFSSNPDAYYENLFNTYYNGFKYGGNKYDGLSENSQTIVRTPMSYNRDTQVFVTNNPITGESTYSTTDNQGNEVPLYLNDSSSDDPMNWEFRDSDGNIFKRHRDNALDIQKKYDKPLESPLFSPEEVLLTAGPTALKGMGKLGELAYNYTLRNPNTSKILGAGLEAYFLSDLINRRGINNEHPNYGYGDNLLEQYINPGLQDAMDASIGIGALTKMPTIANNMYNFGKVGLNNFGNYIAEASNGRLYDPYTTIGGRFGYYGNWPKRIYNTVARNIGLEGTNSMPELLRLEKRIDLTNPETYAYITRESIGGRFPWMNSTTSRFVVDHSNGNWKGNSGIVYDPQMFSAENYLSVQPSDTFIQGAKNVTSPKQFTLVSGNVEELKAAQKAGLETLSTPEMRRAYEAFKTTEAEAEAAGIGTFKVGRFRLGKGTLHDDRATIAAANNYTQTMNEAVARRGTPTYQDYQYQAEQAGLPIEVTEGVPVYDRVVGFGVDADGKSMHLTEPYYNNIVYHNASPIESKVRTAMHVGKNPTKEQVKYWKAHPEELKELARNTATFNKEVTINGQTFKVRQNPDGSIDMSRGLDANGNIINLELSDSIMATDNVKTSAQEPTTSYLDWSPESYLKEANKYGARLDADGNPIPFDKQDIKDLQELLPEFRKIEQEGIKNGDLLVSKDGKSIIVADNSEMSPYEYIIRNSKAGQQYEQGNLYTGVPQYRIDEFNANAGGHTVWSITDSPQYVEEYAVRNSGGVPNYNIRKKELEQAISKLKLEIAKPGSTDINEKLVQLNNYELELKGIQESLNKDPRGLNNGRVIPITYPKDAKTDVQDAGGASWSNFPVIEQQGINVEQLNQQINNAKLKQQTLVKFKQYYSEDEFQSQMNEAQNIIDNAEGLLQLASDDSIFKLVNTSTDALVSDNIKKGLEVTRVNNVRDTYNHIPVNDVIIHRGTPTKSFLGNIKMDINNPNIYKSLIPLGIASSSIGLYDLGSSQQRSLGGALNKGDILEVSEKQMQELLKQGYKIELQ